MEPALDYIELALSHPRDRFVAECPYRFLVGGVALVRPRGPQRTQVGIRAVSRTGSFDELAATMPVPSGEATDPSPPSVLAVRKVQENFPAMITVGRTSNNDVVLADVQISKFHAFFRESDGKTELVDSGSRNGTFVRRQAVGKEGARVFPGDPVSFGRLEFFFLDAADCWDLVRRHLRATPPAGSPV